MDLTSPGYRWRVGLLYGAVLLVYGLQANITGPTAKLLAEQAGVRESGLWPIYLLAGASFSLGSLASGWLLEHAAAHAVLAACLSLQGAALLALPFCTSVAAIAAANAADTACSAVLPAVTFTATLVLLGPGGKAGPWFNALSCIYAIGNLMVPLIVESTTAWTGTGSLGHAIAAAGGPASLPPFLAVGACVFATALAALMVPSPPCTAAAAAQQQHKEAGADLQPQSQPQPHERVAFKRANHAWMVWLPGCFFFFSHVTINTSLASWLYTYGFQFAHLPPSTASLINTAYWAASTAGRLLCIPTASVLSPLRILSLTMPLVVVGAALPLLLRGPPTAGVLYLTAIATGLGASTGPANILSLLSSYIVVDGWVNGALGVAMGFGATAMPTLIPWLSQHLAVGWQLLMFTALAAGCTQMAAAFAVAAMGRRLRRLSSHSTAQQQAGQAGGSDDTLEAPLLDPAHLPANYSSGEAEEDTDIMPAPATAASPRQQRQSLQLLAQTI